jgi:hypothetical protein
VVEAAAAFVAWLGAALVVLADGRRGLAFGTALATLGISVIAFDGAGLVAAAALAAGGGIGAAGRLRAGPAGWNIMPPESTPRLVLCIASGLLALWLAAAVTTGDGAPLRFTVMLVSGLAAARVLGGGEPSILLTASGLLALAMGLAAGVEEGTPVLTSFLAAGFLAAAIGWLPVRDARAA